MSKNIFLVDLIFVGFISIVLHAQVAQQEFPTSIDQTLAPPDQDQAVSKKSGSGSVSGVVQPVNVETIKAANKQKKLREKIWVFTVLTRLAQGYTFDPKTQDAYALALVGMFEQKSKGKTKKALRKLLDIAKASPLLNSGQQKYVKTSMLGKVIPAREREQRQREQERQQRQQKKRVAINVEERVNDALGQETFGQKVDALSKLMSKARGKKFEPIEQDMFGRALVAVFGERSGKSSRELKKLLKLLKGTQRISKEKGLLNTDQQEFVKDKMLPEFMKKRTSKPSGMPVKGRGRF